MFRLTREVRFAINPTRDRQLAGKPTNSYAGFPSLTGLGHFFTLQLTLAGALEPASGYLLNIKQIDQAVRERAIPAVEECVRTGAPGATALANRLFDCLRTGWREGIALDGIRLSLSPFLSLACFASEHPMVRLSQKFEFSASHRLHNPTLDDTENIRTYGKCNNPLGHGHNYEVQVTLAGQPDGKSGLLVDMPAFERIVAEHVIERLDHKNLNVEVPEFRQLIPSVENIAMTIFRMLQPKLTDIAASGTRLASVTVWETPKTWCEYSE